MLSATIQPQVCIPPTHLMVEGEFLGLCQSIAPTLPSRMRHSLLLALITGRHLALQVLVYTIVVLLLLLLLLLWFIIPRARIRITPYLYRSIYVSIYQTLRKDSVDMRRAELECEPRGECWESRGGQAGEWELGVGSGLHCCIQVE